MSRNQHHRNRHKNKTVHVHIEQKKSVKRREKSRPKAESSNPFMSSGSINRGISQNLGNLGRGQVMNEPQMPTILQNIQPVVDPKIEKPEGGGPHGAPTTRHPRGEGSRDRPTPERRGVT